MKRTMVLLVLVETDEPKLVETTGADVDELSAIKPTLAKCLELVQDDARRRKAGSK
jgi:hypothetical protein